MSRKPRLTLLFLTVATALSSAAASRAATITVNSTLDISANDGKCTLHEAILAANNDAASGAAAGECAAGSGTDVIHFAIPGSDSGCDGSGVCTILTGGLPSLDTPVTIDGFTQSGATVNTLPYASNAVLKIVVKSAVGGGSGTGFFLTGTGITIRGLVINGGFQNGIGSQSIDGPSGAKVVGCYIGTDASGLNPAFNTWGINVSGDDWQIGGTAAADRNIVTAASYGMVLGNVASPTIQGTLIGVKANGTSVLATTGGTVGVTIFQITGGGLFGGSAAGAGNVLGGFGTGLYVQSILSGTMTVLGNRFGTDGGGVLHLGNRGSAIFADAAPMTIGGTGTGEANIIAFNGLEGVIIGPFSHNLVGVKIRANSIHDNAQIADSIGHQDLGIDIGAVGCCGTLYGPTDNDPLDADTGSNGLQNYPLVNTVTASSIQGTLNSEANKTYTLDFYANASCSASGFGEGETHIGSTSVSTNGSGNATFNFSVTVPAGKKVTATATAPDGSTSEFSRCADLLPRFLEADTDFGSTSDTNGVFEPGETATVRPNWENPTELAIAATSTASALTGPAGASYSTVDATNDYGPITQKFIGNCAVTQDCFTMFVSDPATRPASHWDANFVETMSTREGAKTWKLHLGDSFADVPRSQLFYKKIEAVFHNGVTVGCDAAHYCPDTAVARDQMAIFVARAIAHGGANVPVSGTVGGQSYNCAPGGVSLFTDVAPTSIACKSIHYIAARNVTTGCSPGLYCPTQLVTRAQMAIFVAKGLVAPAGGTAVPLTYTDPAPPHLSYSCDAGGTPHSYFADVTPADSFCKHVNYLYLKNVIAGCSASQYCPNENVTRGEMAKFLSNAFNLLLYGP